MIEQTLNDRFQQRMGIDELEDQTIQGLTELEKLTGMKLTFLTGALKVKMQGWRKTQPEPGERPEIDLLTEAEAESLMAGISYGDASHGV